VAQTGPVVRPHVIESLQVGWSKGHIRPMQAAVSLTVGFERFHRHGISVVKSVKDLDTRSRTDADLRERVEGSAALFLQGGRVIGSRVGLTATLFYLQGWVIGALVET
jgi:hypothetical protein